MNFSQQSLPKWARSDKAKYMTPKIINASTSKTPASHYKTPHSSSHKTPRSTTKTPKTSDRFIPSQVNNQILYRDENVENKKSEFSSMLANSLFENNSKKILGFHSSAISAKTPHSQTITRQKTESGLNKLKVRAINSSPERILDAPGLIDDFYLNLLDWSSHGVVAVALGQSLYLWNNNSIDLLVNIESHARLTNE